jgi:hypothetical protein
MRRAPLTVAIECGKSLPRITCRLGEISDFGVRLLVPSTETVPDEFTFVLKTGGEIRWRCTVIERQEGAVVVRWTDERRR